MSANGIREYFQREASAYPVPASLRDAAVTGASAAGGPVERPAMRWAALVAGLLAVALIAGLLAVGGLRGRGTQPVAPLPLKAPVGSVLVDVDMLGATTGWALGVHCASQGKQCQYFVMKLSDGGASWSVPIDVGPVYATESGHDLSTVHLVDAEDAYVFGPHVTYVTRNAGRTWSVEDFRSLDPIILVGTSPLWLLEGGCRPGDPKCANGAYTSPDGGRTLFGAAPVTAFTVPTSAAAFPGGLVFSSSGRGDMYITRDGGQSWNRIPGTCPADTVTNRIGTSDGAEIWQMCTPPEPNPGAKTLPWTNYVRYTQDGGAHWIYRSLPAGSYEEIAAFGFGRVIEATNTAGILVTQDGGHTWTQVSTPGYFSMVALSWARDGHAWALDVRGTIWGTSDYGAGWSRLPAQPLTPTG